MKKIFFTLISLFGIISISSCIAGTDNGKVIEEDRNVSHFSSIKIESVGNVYFTQSDTYSIHLKGNEKLVKATTTNVKEGTLIVDMENKIRMRGKNKLDIYISAPDLKKVDFDGVGNFKCNEKIELTDVKFDIDGVGNVDIKDLHCHNLTLDVDGVGNVKAHIHCQSLKADIDGVGNVTLSGKAGSSHISKDGVGNVRTKDLQVGE